MLSSGKEDNDQILKPLHNQNQIYTRLSKLNKNYIIKICAEGEK